MSGQVFKIIYILIVICSWMLAYAYWARNGELEWEEDHMFENFSRLEGQEITIPDTDEINNIIDFNYHLDGIVAKEEEIAPEVIVFFEVGTHPAIKDAFLRRLNQDESIGYIYYTSEEEAFRSYHEYLLTTDQGDIASILNKMEEPLLPSSFDIYMKVDSNAEFLIDRVEDLDREISEQAGLDEDQIIVESDNE